MTLEGGQRVYFPRFYFTQGFVVDSPEQEARIRNERAAFARRSSPLVLFGAAVIVAAIYATLHFRLELLPYIGGLIFALLVAYLLADHRSIERTTRGMAVTSRQPALVRRLELRSRLTSPAEAVTHGLLGIFVAGMGLAAWIKVGLGWVVVFMLVIGIAVMCRGVLTLVLQRRDRSR